MNIFRDKAKNFKPTRVIRKAFKPLLRLESIILSLRGTSLLKCGVCNSLLASTSAFRLSSFFAAMALALALALEEGEGGGQSVGK
jgi:hypothetical protein